MHDMRLSPSLVDMHNNFKSITKNIGDWDKSSPRSFEVHGVGAVPTSPTIIIMYIICMNKIQYQKYLNKIRKQYNDKPCEICGKQHNHTYGSGRFCSRKCAGAFRKINETSLKLREHLNKLRLNGKISKKAIYGTWKCQICQIICETKDKLKLHYITEHNFSKINKIENNFICPYCKKEFSKYQSIGAHLISCKMHPLKEFHDLAHKKAGKTYSIKCKTGKITPSFKGKQHSIIARQHMRNAACKYLSKIHKVPCRYNPKSISILESIAKEHRWNIQHAENIGEFYTGIGYFVDAYDKEKNIVIEYDEPKHYIDVENNVLTEKDLKRQKEIINHLHCEFWRYNEKMKLLYKIQNT